MRKCDELKDPRSCLNKARDDEPLFVLRANDPVAAMTVRHWVSMSTGIHEQAKLDEALKWCEGAEKWRNSQPQEAKAG